MKKIIFALFLSSLLYSAHAQIPGYMGLKCSLQYQGGISPQWNNFATTHLPYFYQNAQIGYVISRKHEVGLQYTRIDYSSGFNRDIESGYNSANNQYNKVTMDQRSFTGNNVMAYIKFFRERKGFIAPLGRYFLLGLNYLNTHDRFHVTSDNVSAIGGPNYTNVQSHDLSFTFGIGRNIILFDRMILSIEGDVNVPLSAGIRAAISNPNTEAILPGSRPDIYKYTNSIDAMLVNIIQIKIGLGALLF